MKYLTIVYVRKYWMLASIVIVFFICHYLNSNAPKYFISKARMAVKVNPIANAVGNWYLSQREYRASSHYENLNVPDEAFLKMVSANMDQEVTNGFIQNSFKVDKDRETDILTITTKTSSKTLSKELADNIAQTYENYDLKFRQRNYLEKENWILGQIKDRKQILEQLEIDIKQFKEDNPTFSVGQEVSEVIQLEHELKEMVLQKEEEEHRLSLINLEVKRMDSTIVAEVTRDEPLQKELLNMELELAKLKVEHGEQSRRVKNKQEQMKNIKGLMDRGLQKDAYTTILQVNPRYTALQSKRDDIKSNLSVLSTRRYELEKMVVEAYTKTAKKPQLQLNYSRMNRDKIASEKIYTMLNERLEETRLKKSGVSREIYQIGRASPAYESKSGHIGLGLTLFIGFLVGVVLIFLLEQIDKTLRFPIQIEKIYGLPLLGIIPEMEIDSGKLDLNSDSKILEPYRSLRTNLNYSTPMAGEGKKSIIITSALQGEGKSTKAVNLAICFALEGKKVLLVDSDLRRPSVHGLLGLGRGPGLSEYLTGQSPFKDTLHKTSFHGLTMTPAGNKMPNPAEILGSSRIKNFLEEAYQEFDLVFFDSPAIFPVSDALVLAPQMDMALVVFRSNYTPIKAGEEVLRKLGQVGASVIGGVLNDVRSGKSGYYYSYYGYYGYSYYQTYYEEHHPNTRHPWLHAISKRFKEKFGEIWGGARQFRLMSTLKMLLWVMVILTAISAIVLGVAVWRQQPDYIPLSNAQKTHFYNPNC